MLLQFSVENYKTFSKKATLNMISSNYYKEEKTNLLSISNEYFNYSLLKSAIIYGANASGKSKLFEALRFLQKFIFNSSKESQAKETIKVDVFKLNTANRKKPAVFEIIFLHKDVQYRYGFETTQEKIVSEWFFYKPKQKKLSYFIEITNHSKSIKHFLKKVKIWWIMTW